MTLLFVILLNVGIVLVVSAFEDKPLKETFSDILNNAVTPAQSGQSSGDTTSITNQPVTTQTTNQPSNISIQAPIVRRTP